MTEIEMMDILSKKESLHDDLAEYVERLHGFLALRHPLVYSIPYHEQMNAYLNAQYEHKQAYVRRSLKERDFERFVFIHERPYRLQAFLVIEKDLEDERYWKLASSIYQDSENIFQNFQTWKKIWKTDRAGRFNTMDEEERKTLEDMPKELTIYRGTKYRSSAYSLSWTIDRDRAVWFARRFRSGNGYLAETIISKTNVLAYLANRNESEIVCLPKKSKIVVNMI